ncbi:MAG: hypothetical protein WDZ83_08405 [Rhizobiaceae bacterium]
MDWNLAIKRNREALSRILAALFALVGLPEGRPASGPLTLPRHLHAHALRILRAAESAIRRLVVIAAREIDVQPRPAGGFSMQEFGGKRQADAAVRIPAFPLLDPLRKFSFDPPRRASRFMPRICVVGFTEPAPLPVIPVLSPDDPVAGAGLCRRLLSSRRALANLPREARRLARWQARNRLRSGPGRVAPLRFGAPPGRRKRPIHLVDDILKECHSLALDVLSPPDTS